MILNGLLAPPTRIDVFNSESVTVLFWSTRADCAGIGSSDDLLRGFRMAPGRVGFRFVPALRVSKQRSEKFGSACC